MSRPGWLVTYRNKVPPSGVEPGHVTHPSTNRARSRVTLLIRPTSLPLRHGAQRHPRVKGGLPRPKRGNYKQTCRKNKKINNNPFYVCCPPSLKTATENFKILSQNYNNVWSTSTHREQLLVQHVHSKN